MFVRAGYNPVPPAASLLPPQPHWPLAAVAAAGAAAHPPAAAPGPGVHARHIRAAAIAQRVNAAHAAAAGRAAARRQPSGVRSRTAAAQLRRMGAARRRHCRGMGDFFDLNMFTPAAIGASPAAAPSPTSAPAPTPKSAPAPTQKSGGANSYWANLVQEFAHPTQTAQQIAGLWGSQTPGNTFDKIESITANAFTAQQTPAQYQLTKYTMAQNLAKAGATSAQIAQQESALDNYVRADTAGLAGGADPGSVPYSKPNATIPWWVWAAAGGGFLILFMAAKR